MTYKISANGQITVPVGIYRILELKFGDNIMFLENNDGEIVINNASAQAIYKAQIVFSGVAESLGIEDDDDDVMELVSEVRYGGKQLGYL